LYHQKAKAVLNQQTINKKQNMKKNILIAAFAMVAGAASAQNVAIENSNRPAVYNVVCRSAQPVKAQITVSDLGGETIMVDEVTGTNFARPYNFENLPFGDYQVAVTTAEGTKNLTINHKDAELVKNVAIKSMDNSKYQLTVMGNKAENVLVNIYDRERELVYSDVIKTQGNVSRVYDLNRINSNSYVFEVMAADKVVSSISVK
jgi:hypothetical protein